MKCGVYFLLKRDKVVYVGMTTRFPFRFNLINGNFDFDRIRLIECSESVMSFYENRWIKKFNPMYNVLLRPGLKHAMIGRKNPNAGNKPGNSKFNKLKIGDSVTHKKGNPYMIIKHYNKMHPDRELVREYVGPGKYLVKRIK